MCSFNSLYKIGQNNMAPVVLDTVCKNMPQLSCLNPHGKHMVKRISV